MSEAGRGHDFRQRQRAAVRTRAAAGHDRSLTIDRARSARRRAAGLHWRTRAAQQRAAALMRESAALVRAAEQIRSGMTRQELLIRLEQARLRARMQTMPVIEQAKGILMAEQRCGPDEAFDLLRQASQRTNVKVHVLAALLVEQVSSGQHSGESSKAKSLTPVPRTSR